MDHYKKTRQQLPYRDYINITWNLTSKCNYSCHYCNPEWNDGKFGFPTIDNAVKFINTIRDKYPDKTIIVDLSGGEPTLWPKLPEFLKTYKDDERVFVVLLTNASRSVKWWKRNISIIDSPVLSFHYETSDKEHFYNICKIISDNNKTVTVNCLMEPGNFEHLVEYGQKVVNEIDNVVFNFKPIRPPADTSISYEYTESEREFLKETSRLKSKKITTQSRSLGTNILEGTTDDGIVELFDLKKAIASKNISFTGWKCNAGIECYAIMLNGDIMRGQCRVGGKLGNIHGTYSLDVEPIICTATLCNCITDLYTSKAKSNETL